MGRPRKPASLKKGKSETKEHLEARAEVEQKLKGSSDLIYNIPEQLDELAIEYYKFLIEELEDSNILSNLDIPILTQTADCLSKMEQADSIIKSEGIIFYKPDNAGNNEPREHPAVGIKQKYLNQFRALSTQLGLSPSSRAALAEKNMEKEAEKEDPVAKILSQFNKKDEDK